MNLQDFMNENKDIEKVQKKLKKIIKKKDKKGCIIFNTHIAINLLFWLILFCNTVNIAFAILATTVFSFITTLLTVSIHIFIMKKKFKNINKYNSIFEYHDKEADKFIRKNKKYINIYKEKEYDKNNLIKSLLIKALQKSTKKDILSYEKEIKKITKNLNIEEKDYIKKILEERVKIKEGEHELDYIFKENKKIVRMV